ncbi:MAG: DUF2877 domain-containing protein [Candidatus Promineifilaceae bacterium]
MRGSNAQVFQLFDRAASLLTDREELLSLVVGPAKPGPFSLVIRSPAGLKPESLHNRLTIGAPLRSSQGAIYGSNIRIDISQALLWRPALAAHEVVPAAIQPAAAALREVLATAAPDDSLAGLVRGRADGPYHQQASRAWRDLAAGWRANDPRRLSKGASRLAGLGPGLTPAGDDFLMGCLLASAALGTGRPEAGLAEAVVEAGRGRTNRLALAHLQAAAGGEASWDWHELIGGMAAGDWEDVAKTGRRIAALGHTSGADALTGFVLGLELFARAPDGAANSAPAGGRLSY